MRTVFLVALFVAIPVLSPGAVPTTLEKVRDVCGIEAYRLKANGLSVLLLEDHSTPVVTLGVTYHVGSRDDPAGASGEAHLLEHMMFRGTPRFNARQGTGYDETLAGTGAA